MKYTEQEQRILNRIQDECTRQGLSCDCRFGEVHIRSSLGNWKFDLRTDGYVKLYHQNPLSSFRGLNKKDVYHVQFSRRMKARDVVRYIAQHDTAKYTNTFVHFSYAKDGAVLSC